MCDVVIKQKYIDRIAKELIINILDFMNDDYFLQKMELKLKK